MPSAPTRFTWSGAAALLSKPMTTARRRTPNNKSRRRCLWGNTGTGKTRYAVERGAFKWSPPSDTTKEWWDGYAGEKSILIDEFYGQMKPSRLQELLDGYMCRMDIKGSHTYAMYDTVYITSNVSPDEWYGDNVPQEVKNSLKRRLTKYGGEIKHITDPMEWSDDEEEDEDEEPFIL